MSSRSNRKKVKSPFKPEDEFPKISKKAFAFLNKLEFTGPRFELDGNPLQAHFNKEGLKITLTMDRVHSELDVTIKRNTDEQISLMSFLKEQGATTWIKELGYLKKISSKERIKKYIHFFAGGLQKYQKKLL